MKLLVCTHPNPELGIEVGQMFRVTDENEHLYQISIPIETEHGVEDSATVFTKEPDFEGYSYKNWFELLKREVPVGDE